MHLRLYIVFLVSAASGLKIDEPSFKAINFARAISGLKLNGSVFKEKEVDSEISCQIEWVRESRCLSHSFEPSLNKNRFKCELSDSDRFSGVNNLTEEEDVSYRGIQVHLSSILLFLKPLFCIHLQKSVTENFYSKRKFSPHDSDR